MSAVRSGYSSSVSTKVKKDRKIAVNVPLHIGSGRYKEYIATRTGKGGGTRKNKMDRTHLLEDIFQYFEQFFFPSCRARGKFSVNLNSTSIKFCLCANEVTTGLSYSIDNCTNSNCLKRAKFIIQAKAMSKLQEYESDSSLSDFDIASPNNRMGQKRWQSRQNISPGQGKDALTSSMLAAKILMNSECKKSEMRHSLQNQPTEI